MRNPFTNYAALVRRELSVYFISPMAYIILTAFLFLSGGLFCKLMFDFADARMPVEYGAMQKVMVSLLTFVTPLVTMRLIAEEKNRGTIEIMMTAPISEWAFVLAKFTAAFVFVSYLLSPTICYVILAAKYGVVDLGAVAAGYAGILLAIGAVLALGLCISAMCANQITAGVLTLIGALALIIMPLIGSLFPPHATGLVGIVQRVFEHVNLLGHMDSFSRGIVDARPAVYLLSVIFLFLFLTVRVVESRRWR
ncbi:MAG: ABC transporter permease [Planctomycetes bacterium]|nr:ABC transporter permease [Planctomycetota bacterium]